MQCQKCGRPDATRNRQNTAYTASYSKMNFIANDDFKNDEQNYATLCSECQEEVNEYWKERWSDYYAGLL
jgi:hypothetical protein